MLSKISLELHLWRNMSIFKTEAGTNMSEIESESEMGSIQIG